MNHCTKYNLIPTVDQFVIMRLKHSHCPIECGDKLVLVFDHWVGFDFSEDKNPNTKAHIKLFNDGYTQRPHLHFDITRYQ